MDEHEPPIEPPPRTTLERPRRSGAWMAVAALVLVVAVVVWFLLLRSRPATPPAPVAEAPAAQPAAEAPPPVASTPAGPATLDDVSSHPLYRRAIGEGDVRRRWAIVTDNLAEGVSPRKQLEFLAPSKAFSVARRGDATVIAPESYQRYDAFADAVGSVDVAKLLTVYRTLHLELESAYRALGYPGASLDAASVRALRRILAVPIPKGDLPVEETAMKGVYAFSDPQLEERSAVEKHLLRMGPRNIRILQAKAREILQQLGPVRVDAPKPGR